MKDEYLTHFNELIDNQYKSKVYEKLKKEGRLNRFIRAIQFCAFKNMSIKATCKYLSKTFPSYFRGEGLSPETFAKMIDRYKDIREAWGYNREDQLFMVFMHTQKLALETEKVSDGIDFIKAFDTEGDFIAVADIEGDTDNTVTYTINRREGTDNE